MGWNSILLRGNALYGGMALCIMEYRCMVPTGLPTASQAQRKKLWKNPQNQFFLPKNDQTSQGMTNKPILGGEAMESGEDILTTWLRDMTAIRTVPTQRWGGGWGKKAKKNCRN